MKRIDDDFVFSSGKSLLTTSGLISLDMKSGDLFEGYDSSLYRFKLDHVDSRVMRLTKEERVELAAFVAQEWLRWGRRED